MRLSRLLSALGLVVAVVVLVPRPSYAGGGESKVDKFVTKALDHNHKHHDNKDHNNSAKAAYHKVRAGRNARHADAARHGKLKKYSAAQRAQHSLQP